MNSSRERIPPPSERGGEPGTRPGAGEEESDASPLPAPSARRSPLSLLLRSAIAIALLYGIFRLLGSAPLHHAARAFRNHPVYLLLSVLAILLALLAGAVRWQIVLCAADVRLPFAAVLRDFFVGQFFNAFLLGACGGDAARAWCLSRRLPGRSAEALASVVIDRAVGLLLTLALALPLILPVLPRLSADVNDLFAPVGILLLLAAAALALLRCPSVRRRLPRRIRGFLDRFLPPILALFRRPIPLLLTLLLSAANLFLLALSAQLVAWAIDIPLAFRDLLAVYPLSTLLAALPVTPGGLGFRETVFVVLLAPFAVPPDSAVALSLVAYALSSLASLFALPLLLPGLRQPLPPKP